MLIACLWDSQENRWPDFCLFAFPVTVLASEPQPWSVRSRESGLLGVELPAFWRDLIAYLKGAHVQQRPVRRT